MFIVTDTVNLCEFNIRIPHASRVTDAKLIVDAYRIFKIFVYQQNYLFVYI